jgi:hypothetical protein
MHFFSKSLHMISACRGFAFGKAVATQTPAMYTLTFPESP